jgi:hypothetical protein
LGLISFSDRYPLNMSAFKMNAVAFDLLSRDALAGPSELDWVEQSIRDLSRAAKRKRDPRYARICNDRHHLRDRKRSVAINLKDQPLELIGKIGP